MSLVAKNSRWLSYEEARALGRLHVYQFERCGPKYRGGGVYVLAFDNGIKIGMAKNLCSRMKHYQSPWIREIKKAAYYATANPGLLEHKLKNQFARCIVNTNSTEFILGMSFEYLVRDIERSPFFQNSA